MELIHMVQMFGLVSIIMLIQITVITADTTIGKFPFLMPNVHPYRVRKLINSTH